MTTLFRLAPAFFVGALIGTSCASLTAALDAPRLALAAFIAVGSGAACLFLRTIWS